MFADSPHGLGSSFLNGMGFIALDSVTQCLSSLALPKNTIFAKFDVFGLFTNISHDEGLHCRQEGLEKRYNPKMPTEFLLKLMKLILQNNTFTFHDGYWKQNIGAAMGSRPVPSYANIFMAKMDRLIKELNGAEAIQLMKRFLDDFFIIFLGSSIELHDLFQK